MWRPRTSPRCDLLSVVTPHLADHCAHGGFTCPALRRSPRPTRRLPRRLRPPSLSVRSLPRARPLPLLAGKVSAGGRPAGDWGWGQHSCVLFAVVPVLADPALSGPSFSLLGCLAQVTTSFPWPRVTVSAEGWRRPASGRLAILYLVRDPLSSSFLKDPLWGRFSCLGGPGLTAVVPLQASACSTSRPPGDTVPEVFLMLVAMFACRQTYEAPAQPGTRVGQVRVA